MTLHYGQRRAEALHDWAVDAARTLGKIAPKEVRR